MLTINYSNNTEEIKKAFERDLENIESVLDSSLNPLTRALLNIKLNPNYSVLYNFATEDIASYITSFNSIENYLTVCASGDQVINAIIYGAKNIDTFDINFLSKHALILKLSSIKCLNSNDIVKLFTTYDPKLLEKVISNTDIMVQQFWESIFKEYRTDIVGEFFGEYKIPENTIYDINPYLIPNNLEQLKSLLDSININFIESDLYSLPKFLKNKYDAINLSNIYEYLNFDTQVNFENAKQFYDFITQQLVPYLNNNGTILLCYLYAFSKKTKKHFDELYKTTKFVKLYNSHTKLTSESAKALQQGLTTQNLAYSQLYDVFNSEQLIEIQTQHMNYGQSIDTSHDTALILRK